MAAIISSEPASTPPTPASPSNKPAHKQQSLYEQIASALSSLPLYTFTPYSDHFNTMPPRSSSWSSTESSAGVRTPSPQSPALLPTTSKPSSSKPYNNSTNSLFHHHDLPAFGWASPDIGVIHLPPQHRDLPIATPSSSINNYTSSPAVVSSKQPKSSTTKPTGGLGLQHVRAKQPRKRSGGDDRLALQDDDARDGRPSRAEEENARGRSRWPRLLWNSTIDDESLDVLKSYHERAVGGPLPVLERRERGRRAVKEWSERLERAGL
ncbi:hypothetical protein T439DRAFT_360287 [Meredithblackwellia eburnea MCA 4105]